MAAITLAPTVLPSFPRLSSQLHRPNLGRTPPSRRPDAPSSASSICSISYTSGLWNPQRMEERAQVVFASESNPGSPDSAQDEKKTSSRSGDGPPFLTILAGLVVLMLIVWIVGSILMWLIGLIVHPPSS